VRVCVCVLIVYVYIYVCMCLSWSCVSSFFSVDFALTFACLHSVERYQKDVIMESEGQTQLRPPTADTSRDVSSTQAFLLVDAVR
jgi:hypothetical protein